MPALPIKSYGTRAARLGDVPRRINDRLLPAACLSLLS